MTATLAKGRSARHRWHAPEKGTGPAFLLSLAAHATLFIAIAFVVRWKTEPAGSVSAELWSAAPAPMPAAEPPAPVPPPEPVKPPPPPPPPPPEAVAKPDIVIAPKKIEPPKKVEPPKPEPRKEEKKPPPPDLKAEALKREAAEKAAQAKAAEAQRMAAVNRSLAAAGATAGSPASASAGLSDSYKGQVANCIRPYIVFNVPEGVRPQQYVAEFEVQLLPTGEQAGAPRLLKPSGLAAYDQAVERAIRRCDPFPRPREGSTPRSLRLSFDPIETR